MIMFLNGAVCSYCIYPGQEEGGWALGISASKEKGGNDTAVVLLTGQ